MTFQKTIPLALALLLATPPTAFSQVQKAASKGVNLLEQTSQTFTQIAKKAMPATVFIKAQIPQQGFGGDSPFDAFGDDFFRRFFGMPHNGFPKQESQQPQIAGGSGFFVSEDGYIVTNYHVIKDASKITVVLNDGREFSASISGHDPRTDLAVLKIEEKGLPHLSFGDSDSLDIGEWVVAIGTPFALESSLTVGVVSAKGRQDLGITSLEDFIQTDAAINPGNSGGPLLNLSGEVVGVNTAIMSKTGGYMGIGFSIPSHMVQHVIDQIIHLGSVKRGYLGIVLQSVDKELASALNLSKNQEGVLITDIAKNSPAAKGGLLQGDIILEYSGKEVKNVSKFRNEIALMNPGQEIKLKVLRNGKAMTLSIPLGIQAESESLSLEVIQKMGLDLENVTQELAAKLNHTSDADGVLITKVKPGSPAQTAGLKPSFLITGIAINWNEPLRIHNMAEFEAGLKELGNRKHIILIVRHQNYQRYYTVKLE